MKNVLQCYPDVPQYKMSDNIRPGDPVFNVVQQALRHQRILVKIHQMRRLTQNKQSFTNWGN